MARNRGNKVKQPKKRSVAKSLIGQSQYVSRPMGESDRKSTQTKLRKAKERINVLEIDEAAE